MMANDKYTDYHDELAWIALQRNGGSPVTLEDVTSMFSDLRAHKRNCRCECRWVQASPARQGVPLRPVLESVQPFGSGLAYAQQCCAS